MVQRTPASADYERRRALIESGDFAKAAAALKRLSHGWPRFKSLGVTRRSLMRAGQPQRAIVRLAAATTLNAQVRALSLLAEALLSIGDRLKAHEIAKLALSREFNRMRTKTVFDKTRADPRHLNPH